MLRTTSPLHISLPLSDDPTTPLEKILPKFAPPPTSAPLSPAATSVLRSSLFGCWMLNVERWMFGDIPFRVHHSSLIIHRSSPIIPPRAPPPPPPQPRTGLAPPPRHHVLKSRLLRRYPPRRLRSPKPLAPPPRSRARRAPRPPLPRPPPRIKNRDRKLPQ